MLHELRAQGSTRIGDAGGFARVFERDGSVGKVERNDPTYLSYVRHVLVRPSGFTVLANVQAPFERSRDLEGLAFEYAPRPETRER
jgi:hypothetical protein